jgi:hypothetical protein
MIFKPYFYLAISPPKPADMHNVILFNQGRA